MADLFVGRKSWSEQSASLSPTPVQPASAERAVTACAVVDNLPKVPEEKYDKLSAVLRKVYGQIATVREGVQLLQCQCLTVLSSRSCTTSQLVNGPLAKQTPG